MIESPTVSVEDVQKPRSSWKKLGILTPLKEDKIQKKTAAILRASSSVLYFIRLSWKNKVTLMTGMIEKTRSMETITVLLNTLYSVIGKINAYNLASPLPPIVFDKVLADHNRMLDDKTIDEDMNTVLLWFENLDDKDQIAYLLVLTRNSGGAMIRLAYKLLENTYRQLLRPVRKPSVIEDQIKTEEDKAVTLPDDYEYDPEDPKHQRVLELEKQWKHTIAALRKNIEKQMPKKQSDKNDEKAKKKGGKKSKSGTTKSSSKSQKSKKKKGKREEDNDEDLDWIQIMPIWIVKKIFGYLDRRTLMKVKSVNAYWKWAIDELLKDQKVKKFLNKVDRKLKKGVHGDCTPPSEDIPKRERPRLSHAERRLKRLEYRGAILESLRRVDREATDTAALTVTVLKKEFDSECGKNLDMYPRVVRTNPPLYRKPDYVVKDLNIICKTRDDVSEDGTEGTKSGGNTETSTLTDFGSYDYFHI